MAINLSALSDAMTTASALSNLILVSPQKNTGYQPQNLPSFAQNTEERPKSLLFHYEGEQSITLTSDITDHYTEENSAIQDQISLKPERITTQGFIGELNNVTPAALAEIKIAAEKLTNIAAYTPSLSTTALLAYNTAFQLYQVAKAAEKSAVDTWSSINNTGGLTRINGSTRVNANGEIDGAFKNQSQQQIYFQQFYAYWKNRTLFTVQTPWAIFQDMAIESIRAVQGADSSSITDFELTFKLMRFATTEIVKDIPYDQRAYSGRTSLMGEKTTQTRYALNQNLIDYTSTF